MGAPTLAATTKMGSSASGAIGYPMSVLKDPRNAVGLLLDLELGFCIGLIHGLGGPTTGMLDPSLLT
jgi:hypothetical protein